MATTKEDPQPLDIFGKPIEITAAEKNALGNGVRVFLHRVLQSETHARRGDQTEPKSLVITSSRCYIISHRPSVKIETSFNFLKIKLLECSENKLSFHLDNEAKPRELLAERKNSVTIVGLILGQLKNLFPVTPIDSLIKVSYGSESLNSEVSLLHESLRQAMESLDPNTIESFITIYGFLCDLHGISYLEEISTYLRVVYCTNGFRELDLCDFEHITMRDLVPLISAVRHNQYFNGVSAEGMKLTPEIFEELSQTLVHCNTLKKFKLINCFIRPEAIFQHSALLKVSSNKSVLTHIDLSKNQLDEKGIDSFCMALEFLQLQSLSLSSCKITAKTGSLIAQAMKKNQNLLYSLTQLDLSDNPLNADCQPALAFIQEPQTISSLNLSKCGLNFDMVFPVLLRGCQQHLRELNLSQNKTNLKKAQIPSVAQSMQQFFSTAISLKHIDISDSKLSYELAIAIMEGLSVNPNIQDTTLNISNNELGHGMDVREASNSLSRLKNVGSLNIANTGIDQHLSRLFEALVLNKTIRHLSIGQNFEGKGNSRLSGMQQLCRLVKADDCCIESLNIADSKLKELTPLLLNALISNDSIVKLDISGNQMGTAGVRALVKLLLSGTQLQELQYGNNEIPAAGFTYIADALEHNYTLLSLPTPLLDVSKLVVKEDVEKALARIQSYLCRNHSDEKLGSELAKRHQLRLLTTSQQSALISREVVQVEEMLTKLSKYTKKPSNYEQEVSKATNIKEEANKVLQLVDSLYSPEEESQQYGAIINRVQSVLEREVEELYRVFVQENIERMVTQSVKTCPSFLDETNREVLRQIGHRELQNELMEAKKAVTRKTAPEIINHISGMNLETAAVISELIVDRTLDELEECTGRLHTMAEFKTTASSPSKRVSKMFSFRTKDQESPHNKRRRRVEEQTDDELSLPANPLSTDGPALQHLGAQRPRPNRKHRNRPGGVKRNVDGNEPTSVWDALGSSADDIDSSTPLESDKSSETAKTSAVDPVEEAHDTTSKSSSTPPKTPPMTPPKTPPMAKKSSEEAPPTTVEETSSETQQERKSVSTGKKRSGISKLFGSRKEKPSSNTSPSPSPSPSPAPPTPSPGATPTPSPVPPSPTTTKDNKRASDVINEEYILVDKNKSNPPPAVKSKPPRPKSTEIIDDAVRTNRQPPVGAAGGQLANVLLQNISATQLKSTKTKEETKETKEETRNDGGPNDKATTGNKKTTVPPAVANKPKRSSAKLTSPDHTDSKRAEDEKKVDVAAIKETANEVDTSDEKIKDKKDEGNKNE